MRIFALYPTSRLYSLSQFDTHVQICQHHSLFPVDSPVCLLSVGLLRISQEFPWLYLVSSVSCLLLVLHGYSLVLSVPYSWDPLGYPKESHHPLLLGVHGFPFSPVCPLSLGLLRRSQGVSPPTTSYLEYMATLSPFCPLSLGPLRSPTTHHYLEYMDTLKSCLSLVPRTPYDIPRSLTTHHYLDYMATL